MGAQIILAEFESHPQLTRGQATPYAFGELPPVGGDGR